MILNKTITLDAFGEVSILAGISIQLICAIFIGFMIGFNRELNNKAAGIKTNIMICIGATLYTSLSLLNISHGIPGQDPNRIAAQIVSGIGFLGAGAIMRGDGHISGLTTAATIWVIAAIGVAIGFGFPVIALGASLVVLLILVGTNKIYSIFTISKLYKIKIISETSVKSIIRGVILNSSVELVNLSEGKTDDFDDTGKSYYILKLLIEGNNKTVNSFARLTKKLKSVSSVTKNIVD